MSNGLTIGIPVYNEEERIERAIRCSAPQCERLIVADNASTDETASICQRLLSEYPNINYFRHKENTGAANNWSFILDQIETPYLMFLGSHDYIDDDYIEPVLRAIESDEDVEIAIGGVCFEFDDRSEDVQSFNDWTGGLNPDAQERVRAFLFDRPPLGWASYGIFRTSTYRSCFAGELPAYGPDLIFLARVMEHGQLKVVKSTRFHAWKRRKGEEKATNKPDYFERVTGSKHSGRDRRRLRNELRVAVYGVVKGLSPSSGLWWKKLAVRFECMRRFKPFRVQGPDVLFYLFYVPVKVVRKFDQLKRRINRGR